MEECHKNVKVGLFGSNHDSNYYDYYKNNLHYYAIWKKCVIHIDRNGCKKDLIIEYEGKIMECAYKNQEL